MASSTYDVLVVGAGINGLSTCYHLARMGVSRIGLIERFELAHSRGSSHGHSRVTRSAYINAHYVRLMQIAHAQEWPRLERDAGEQFIFPTPGCFFGPPGSKYETYARALSEGGIDAEHLTPNEARRLFPQFRFENAAGVLHDRTAGVVAASRTIDALIRLARQNGVDVHTKTRVMEIDPARSPIAVETDRGVFQTERLIVTAGAWVAHLLPVVKPRITIARQTVGYFTLAGDAEAYRVGRFPVWGYFLEGDDIVYYGLPEFGCKGIKLARHITEGVDDDPDDTSEALPPKAVEDLERFLAAQFTAPAERLEGTETCLYTNTATEDFILDPHPEHPNITIGAGFSGHGFKFGPLTGRILAELSLNGKTDLPEFETARDLFRL